MILPIVTEPNPGLHVTCAAITDITPEIVQLAHDMRETMHAAQGIGLAAPQVGRAIRLIVIEYEGGNRGDEVPFLALVNPRITWSSTERENMTEGCLSLPGIEGDVARPRKVRAKALDLEGNQVEIEASSILARVLQHEIDHLNGKLFTEYIPKKQLRPRDIVPYPTA
jgi:peptide deformylase